MREQTRSVLQETTPTAITEAKALLRGANHGALAAIEPGSGDPLVSRVGLATLADGAPLIVISALAAHSAALAADPRCALLVGDAGKGEPLAHPRLSLKCRAVVIPREAAGEARERYLAAHSKAGIYVDLPDFRFWRLVPLSASFNAGFGRAYVIEGRALLG